MALRARALQAAGLLLVGLLTGAATVRAVLSELALPAGCGAPDPLAGMLTAAAGAGAFGLGHLFARYRASGAELRAPRHPLLSAVVVRALVAAVLLLAALVALYETAALLRLGGLLPITVFVRCARGQAPEVTALVAGAVCFLVGHWLWYPPESSR